KALVVDHDRARRTGPLPGLPLLRVEGSPLRTFIDDHVIEDEPAVFADDFGARIVPDEMVPAALRTCRCNLDLTHFIRPPPRRTSCMRNRTYISPSSRPDPFILCYTTEAFPSIRDRI